MPQVVIRYRPDALEEAFPILGTQVDDFSVEILAIVTGVVLEQMKDRTKTEWQPTDMKMDADVMPRINRNRFALEVAVFSTNGSHWQGIEEATQQKLNSALLSFLITKGLTSKGWKASAWVQLVGGSYGDTDQAARRDTIAMQSQRP